MYLWRPLLALTALLLFVALSVSAHTYGTLFPGTANAGVVAWDCGPGFEYRGSVGFFWEIEC
jgi:hypothetical protein